MKTFSILLAWQDNDPEQGEFGWTGRAENVEEAEGFARKAMRQAHVDEHYCWTGDGCSVEEFVAPHIDEEGNFGGRVIDAHEGAMWKAGDMEVVLREFVAVIKGDYMNGDACLVDWNELRPIHQKAKKLIEEIDNG